MGSEEHPELNKAGDKVPGSKEGRVEAVLSRQVKGEVAASVCHLPARVLPREQTSGLSEARVYSDLSWACVETAWQHRGLQKPCYRQNQDREKHCKTSEVI